MTGNLVQQQFGKHAQAYATSHVHAKGASLKRVVELVQPQPGWQVLDIATGAGHTAFAFAPLVASVTATDITTEMLEVTGQGAAERSLENLRTEFADAANLPFADASFDRITIGFGFRNLTWENPAAGRHMAEMSRVLKPGGRLLILESSVPPNRLVEAGYRLYLRLVLVPLGGLLSGDWNAYRYLAGSSSGFYTFEKLKEMMSAHQFHLEKAKNYLFGSANLLVATRIPG